MNVPVIVYAFAVNSCGSWGIKFRIRYTDFCIGIVAVAGLVQGGGDCFGRRLGKFCGSFFHKVGIFPECECPKVLTILKTAACSTMFLLYTMTEVL